MDKHYYYQLGAIPAVGRTCRDFFCIASLLKGLIQPARAFLDLLLIISRKLFIFIGNHAGMRVRADKILGLISVLYLLNSLTSFAQDGGHINVHFLYGSKPLKANKGTERKWFGGILGGHVGIEGEQEKVLNFMRKGKVHVFASARNRNSRYAVNSTSEFWRIFRTQNAAVKKTSVAIPITLKQRQIFDSLSRVYLENTPYDYAFFGMRCGAASYDILSHMGIVKQYSYRRTFMKIFYPRKLRKRLLKIAEKNDWEVTRQDGAITRKWERD